MECLPLHSVSIIYILNYRIPIGSGGVASKKGLSIVHSQSGINAWRPPHGGEAAFQRVTYIISTTNNMDARGRAMAHRAASHPHVPPREGAPPPRPPAAARLSSRPPRAAPPRPPAPHTCRRPYDKCVYANACGGHTTKAYCQRAVIRHMHTPMKRSYDKPILQCSGHPTDAISNGRPYDKCISQCGGHAMNDSPMGGCTTNANSSAAVI